MDGLDLLRASALKGTPFELVLLDYHMPHMDGLEVVQAMRRLGLTPKIIALASHIDRRLPSDPSISAFSAKPIRRRQLLHMICSTMLPLRRRVVPSDVAQVSSPSLLKRSLQIEGNEEVAKKEVRHTVESSLAGLSVLLAEDNESNRVVIARLLQQAQCVVTEATNGVEAIEMLTPAIDVVVMGVHMPVMDGIEATRLMLQRRPRLPVLILTADVTEDKT